MASGFSWLTNACGMEPEGEGATEDASGQPGISPSSSMSCRSSSNNSSIGNFGSTGDDTSSIHELPSRRRIVSKGLSSTAIYQAQYKAKITDSSRSSSTGSSSSSSLGTWLAKHKTPSVCSDESSDSVSDDDDSISVRTIRPLSNIEEMHHHGISNNSDWCQDSTLTSSSSSSSSEGRSEEVDRDQEGGQIREKMSKQSPADVHDIQELKLLQEVFDHGTNQSDNRDMGSINGVVLMQSDRNKENISSHKKNLRSLQEYMYNIKADKNKKLCYDVDQKCWAYDEEEDCNREEMEARSAATASGRIKWGTVPVSGRYIYPKMEDAQQLGGDRVYDPGSSARGEASASCLRVLRRSIFRPTPQFVWQKTTLSEPGAELSDEEGGDSVIDRCLSDPDRRGLLEELYPPTSDWVSRISASATLSSLLLKIPIQATTQPTYGTFNDGCTFLEEHDDQGDNGGGKKVAGHFGMHGTSDGNSLRESTADSMDTHYSSMAFLGARRLDQKHEYYNLPSLADKENVRPRAVSYKELLVPASRLGKLKGFMPGYSLRLLNKLSSSGGTASPKKLGYLPVRVTDANLEGVAARLADWKHQRGVRKVGYASQLSVITEESYPPTPFSGLSREQTKAEVLAGLEDGSMGKAVGRKLVELKSSIGSLGKKRGNQRRPKRKIAEIGKIEGGGLVAGEYDGETGVN